MEDLSRLPPAELTRRGRELLQKACPEKQDETFFNKDMQVAKALGYNWLESLQYVIQKRRELN